MSNSTAQVLMRKGKRGAAAYIHADCLNGSPQHLGPLLDVLLNPGKAIDEWETIDWCRWLIAGGRTPDEFSTVVRSYDKHDKCGLVWIPRVVAYRCRTCGISPCMSICRECFHRGDHSTHDFNMFLSQAGGACDCGDKSVMKEDGFCSNHGNKCPRPTTAPAELMCVAEAMMPRLILRLLQHFRENSCGTSNSDSYRIAVHECEVYVQMVMELNNMGDLMRSAMTKALINPQMYRDLVEPPFPDSEFGRYMAESKEMYERAIESFPAPEPPDEYRHLPALAPRLQHNTLLEEFIFWTFKYEFPQNVVCFLLNMLPDQDYKEHLTRTFVMHYGRIPLVLEAAADPETLSNRVVHMSVQLFSNEALALRCVQQLHLLHVMVLSLRLMMGKILVQSTLHDPHKNQHYVIDCTRRVMKEHCYWPLVSDFNNVLSHKSVALLFLQDDALVEMWFDFLSMLQGMNVNIRETGSHIEFEPSSYYAAFSCELEAGAYPMWSLLSHLSSSDQAPLAIRLIEMAMKALRGWLRQVTPPSSPRHASFHFPLHRYLAAFLCAATKAMGVAPSQVLPNNEQLAMLAVHPLRVQSFFYEILSGIWVRNGLQIKGQAMTYIQANFCNSMVDMDIYWLQICAAHLPPDKFINMCIDAFGVREWLNMMPLTPTQAAEQEAMVEGLLTFLAILVSSRTNLDNDELTQSRLEVSTLLAVGDKTHSQLLDLMPERSGNAHTRNFETVLKELSVYRAPPRGSENLEQGLFVPRPIVWETYFDPLHVLRRAVHRRDFHASMERFTAYVREKQKSLNQPMSGSLWPPLRTPSLNTNAPHAANLCNSGVLQSALLSVLHRGASARPPAAIEHLLALSVFLMNTALTITHQDISQHNEQNDSLIAWPRRLVGCFPSQDICSNSRIFVGRVYTHTGRLMCLHLNSDSENSCDSPPPSSSSALMVPHDMQVVRSEDSEMDDQSDSGGEIGQLRALEDVGSSSLALAIPSAVSPVQRPQHDLIPNSNHYVHSEMASTSWDVQDDSPLPALPAPQSDNQVQVVAVQEEDSVLLNESILSLLLKLHSQLSGKPDSFRLEDPPGDTGPIGDGPHQTGILLRAMAEKDPKCKEEIQLLRAKIWPTEDDLHADHADREKREKEERSRRARQRQQQLMEEFQRRQKEFLHEMQDMEVEPNEEPVEQAMFHCAICNTTGPSTYADPIGLVVLLQCSAVPLLRRGTSAGPVVLCDGSYSSDSWRGAHLSRALEEALLRWGPRAPWALGGVAPVQMGACAHLAHPRCVQAYLRTLHRPPSHSRPPLHSPHLDDGEFLCPVCRQLANSVLPLSPPPPKPASPIGPQSETSLKEQILEMLLREPDPPQAGTALAEAMGKCMEEMLALSKGRGTASAELFAFMVGLAKTNLECELLQRGDTLTPTSGARYKPRNDCIVPLLEVIGYHTRVLRSADAQLFGAETWRELSGATGPETDGPASAPVLRPTGPDEPMPLLLHDPITLLLNLLLLAPHHPPHIDIQYYLCIVRRVVSLCYYQIVLSCLARADAAGRVSMRNVHGVDGLLAHLAHAELFAEDGPQPMYDVEDTDPLAMEEQIQRLLLPLLRIASLIRSHVYGDALPMENTSTSEFQQLATFLELAPKGKSVLKSADVLLEDTPLDLWMTHLIDAGEPIASRRLLRLFHICWALPRLVELPREYERVFTLYHEKVCPQCGAVPKEATLCLLCGTLLCLKQACCRRQQVCEAVQHAMECGGGTGIFLVVTSTYIIVIRGRRACLWGSLYLDDYDEEDRDLKRGKPLYLSQDRLDLLQAQWIAHRFDHTKRTWVWHRDSL